MLPILKIQVAVSELCNKYLSMYLSVILATRLISYLSRAITIFLTHFTRTFTSQFILVLRFVQVTSICSTNTDTRPIRLRQSPDFESRNLRPYATKVWLRVSTRGLSSSVLSKISSRSEGPTSKFSFARTSSSLIFIALFRGFSTSIRQEVWLWVRQNYRGGGRDAVRIALGGLPCHTCLLSQSFTRDLSPWTFTCQLQFVTAPKEKSCLSDSPRLPDNAFPTFYTQRPAQFLEGFPLC